MRYLAAAAFLLLSSPALAQDGEWTLLAPDAKLGSVTVTSAELREPANTMLGGAPSGLFAWTSIPYDAEERCFRAINLGGDQDWGGGDSYKLCLGDLAAGWVRDQPVIYPFAGAPDIRGCRDNSDTWPRAQHTYGLPIPLGGKRWFWGGGSAFCRGAHSIRSKTAYFVDVGTDPYTWTNLPWLDEYAGFAAGGAAQGSIYLLNNQGKWAIVDAETGYIRLKGNLGAAKVNGVTLPAFTATLGASMGAGAINKDGIFLTGNPAGLLCMDINGKLEGNTDTRFGKNARHPLPIGFTGVKFGVAVLPDGRFSLWLGDRRIWIGRVDCFNPANDEWALYNPPTGPTAASNSVYNKLAWVEQPDGSGSLVGNYNFSEGLWSFKVPGLGDAAPPNPVPQASDFETRRKAPGVFYSFGFDTPVPVSSKAPVGMFLNGQSIPTPNRHLPEIVDGALEFKILNGSTSSDAGQFYVDFALLRGRGIGPGETIAVQWDQYIPASLLNFWFTGTTFKLFMLDRTGTQSCSQSPNLHFVVVKSTWTDMPDKGGGVTAYTRCPASENIEVPGPIVNGSRVFDSQPISDNYLTSRQCWKGHRAGCVPMVADVWATYQIMLTFPTASELYKGKVRWMTRVQVWQTVAGKTDTVIDRVVPVSGVEATMGRGWWLPYMTAKDPLQPHADTFTRIDNIIMSTQRIADPS